MKKKAIVIVALIFVQASQAFCDEALETEARAMISESAVQRGRVAGQSLGWLRSAQVNLVDLSATESDIDRGVHDPATRLLGRLYGLSRSERSRGDQLSRDRGIHCRDFSSRIPFCSFYVTRSGRVEAAPSPLLSPVLGSETRFFIDSPRGPARPGSALVQELSEGGARVRIFGEPARRLFFALVDVSESVSEISLRVKRGRQIECSVPLRDSTDGELSSAECKIDFDVRGRAMVLGVGPSLGGV